jgi:hypothetical protein
MWKKWKRLEDEGGREIVHQRNHQKGRHELMRKQSGGVAALKEIQDENPLLEY